MYAGSVAEEKLALIAFSTSEGPAPELVPGPIPREWMSETREAFANRCLPLLIANQSGWMVLSPYALRATWDGGEEPESVVVERLEGEGPELAMSHFGHGILTFAVPFLFRTPPGYNLLVRGPANLPKADVYPLEGVVETDWSTATFTMNWRLMRPHQPVSWERGEPFAMLVPTRRGELESFDPQVRSLHDDPALLRSYLAWRQSRATFNAELQIPGSAAQAAAWQKDYVHGRGSDGTIAPEHQRKLALRPFRRG